MVFNKVPLWIPLPREADCREEGVALPGVTVNQYPGDRTFELLRRIQDDISLILPMMAYVSGIVIKASPDVRAPLRTYRRLGLAQTADLKAHPSEKNSSVTSLTAMVSLPRGTWVQRHGKRC